MTLLGRGNNFGVDHSGSTVFGVTLWGYLEEQVHNHSFNNVEDLKRDIEEELNFFSAHDIIRCALLPVCR